MVTVTDGRSRSIMIGAVDAFRGTTPTADALAMDELYRREARRLLGMLCVFLGDRSEAEDVLQESFLRVQRSWQRISDHDRAAAYLRSTAFNLARSNWRRRRRRPEPVAARGDDLDASSGIEPDVVGDTLILREDQRAVLSALRRLPDRQRACVLLRFYAGLDVNEVASTLGITSNSVKTHLKRAMAHLRTELEVSR